MPVPLYRDPTGLGLVFIGGTAGTLLRAVLPSWYGPSVAQLYSTLSVNLAGALLLGFLTAWFSKVADFQAPSHWSAATNRHVSQAKTPLQPGSRATWKPFRSDSLHLLNPANLKLWSSRLLLLLGAGFCGGFTTYGTFLQESATLAALSGNLPGINQTLQQIPQLVSADASDATMALRVGFPLLSLSGGALLAWLGMVLGGRCPLPTRALGKLFAQGPQPATSVQAAPTDGAIGGARGQSGVRPRGRKRGWSAQVSAKSKASDRSFAAQPEVKK